MTFDEVQQLEDAALCELIAHHCYGWQPVGPKVHAKTGCTHVTLDGALIGLPDWLTDWNDAMSLAWRYRIMLTPGKSHGAPGMVCQSSGGIWRRCYGKIWASTEAETRRAICRLALWKALRLSHGPGQW